MRLHVVIPHYGDPTPTLSLLDDLRAHLDDEVDVTVVDDASPVPFACPGDGVRIVRQATNRGFGSSVNAGARGRHDGLLVILNSDLRVGPTFLAEVRRAASTWPGAILGPMIAAGDGPAKPTGRRFPTVGSELVGTLGFVPALARFGWFERYRWFDGRVASDADSPAEWVSGAALFVPAAIFWALGGFDEAFFMYGEDVELQWRAHRAGVPVMSVATVAVRHEGGTSSAHRTPEWDVYAQRTYARTTRRRGRSLVARAGGAALETAWCGALALRLRSTEPLTRAASAWAGMGAVIRARDPRRPR